MEIKHEIQQDGEYYCDIDISVKEWKTILQDEDLMKDNYIDALSKFCAEPEHKSTCKTLGEKHDISPHSLNANITHFAKAAQKKLNRFKVIAANGKETYWIIPMMGRKTDDGLFEWTVRPELVEAVRALDLKPTKTMTEYIKFKKLLEYFVAHLEWVANGNTNNRGYNIYIKPLIDSNIFRRTGQGYNGDNIQKQIAHWENYRNGKIHINIQSSRNGGYKTKSNYLNWDYTGINIIANWDGNSIKSLFQVNYLFWLDVPKRESLNIDRSIKSLGLFDNKNEVTEELKNFFDHFNRLIKQHNKMQETQKYTQLLQSNKNLILTGAPGTGKTYLAKQIAAAMNSDDAPEFVQFHPSYDYTDFVEGLRPFKKEGEDLGFQLKDGVFKAFCKKALKNLRDSQKTQKELAQEEIVSQNIHNFLDAAIENAQNF